MKKWFSILALLFVAVSSFGQIEFGKDKVKVDFSIDRDGDEAYVIANVKVVDHWHINAINLPEGSFGYPSRMEVTKNSNFKLIGAPIEPKPHTFFDDATKEMLAQHDGKFKIKQKIKILSDKDFEIDVLFDFQTCDSVHCLTPDSYSATLKVLANKQTDIENNVDSVVNTAEIIDTTNSPEDSSFQNLESDKSNLTDNHSNEKSNNDENKEKEESSLWVVFFGSFGAGFLAIIMPCVFPMIPMTVSFFTKRSKSRASGIKNSLMYGLSIVLIHLLLGGIVVITGAGELLNQLSTNVYFNLAFFLMLMIFGISFLGAFEIQLPSRWVNKADAKADKGGVVGIFFMALVLSLASFSCTGPLLGSLLGALSSSGGGTALMVGMFGFGLALALPFMLFSIFPAWMNSMPKSGGWLNVVKVFLGFIEIAFAFKFLSSADTTMQWHILEREVFIAIWIAVFGTLAIYLFGKIRLPHDSQLEKLSVGRTLLGTLVLAFTLYLIPGLWGAPLNLVNAYLPPDFYAESPGGLLSGKGNNSSGNTLHVDGLHEGPQGIMAFKDYDKALAYAKEVNKPLFIDFTGWGCVNCRAMENKVWGKPGIIEKLRNDVVIVSLYVDERSELPKEEQKTVEVAGRKIDIKTVGDKWTVKQMTEYQTNSQPYYIMQSTDGEDLSNGSATYQDHGKAELFQKWLDSGLDDFKKTKK